MADLAAVYSESRDGLLFQILILQTGKIFAFINTQNFGIIITDIIIIVIIAIPANVKYLLFLLRFE